MAPPKKDKTDEQEQVQGEGQSQEETERIAQEREEALATKEGQFAGGTAGGASESQQPEETQSGPASVDEGGEGVGSKREVPELDSATAAGVNPLPATAVDPALSYDDSAAGFPVDEEDDNDEG